MFELQFYVDLSFIITSKSVASDTRVADVWNLFLPIVRSYMYTIYNIILGAR